MSRQLDREPCDGSYPVMPTIVFFVFSMVSGTSSLLIIVEWINEGMMEFMEYVKYYRGPGLHKYLIETTCYPIRNNSEIFYQSTWT